MQEGCLLSKRLFIRLSLFQKIFEVNYNLSKQQALDVDRKAIKQINFTGNLDTDGKTTILDFSHRIMRVLWYNIEM